jgi:DNA-binding CsgD family transcriptional regulator
LLATADLAARIGDRVAETTALHDLCRIGHPREAAERLETVAREVDGPLVAAKARHARALLDADPDGLADAAGAFSGMGVDLLAAEAACDAAVAWRRDGDSRRALAAERTVGQLVGRCAGARTPALQPASARAALTPMERQVALLAAAQRPSKAIAAELHISARTVSNHLQRVYAKLGINSRAELTESLRGDLETT